MERMVVLMKQLQDMVKNDSPSIALGAMSTSILTELYGQLSLNFHRESSSERQKQIYQDILDYIKTNISKPLRISEIAAHFGYNEKYLSHRFAEVFHIPLKQYIFKGQNRFCPLPHHHVPHPTTDQRIAAGSRRRLFRQHTGSQRRRF